MLISDNSMRVEKVSSPGVAALLVSFTGGTKCRDNLFGRNSPKWRGRFIWMCDWGSVGQIEEYVSSNDIFRGGEINTWAAGG